MDWKEVCAFRNGVHWYHLYRNLLPKFWGCKRVKKERGKDNRKLFKRHSTRNTLTLLKSFSFNNAFQYTLPATHLYVIIFPHPWDHHACRSGDMPLKAIDSTPAMFYKKLNRLVADNKASEQPILIPHPIHPRSQSQNVIRLTSKNLSIYQSIDQS